jgi:hypothetical protein
MSNRSLKGVGYAIPHLGNPLSPFCVGLKGFTQHRQMPQTENIGRHLDGIE